MREDHPRSVYKRKKGQANYGSFLAGLGRGPVKTRHELYSHCLLDDSLYALYPPVLRPHYPNIRLATGIGGSVQDTVYGMA